MRWLKWASMADQTTSDVKTFSVEQAQRALVYVRPILEELRSLFREFTDLREALADRSLTGNKRGEKIDRLEVVKDEIIRCSDEIERLGAQVKSFEEGLIDFPYRRPSGAIVLLCFKLGEEAITHWHEAEAGFGGRRPLNTLD